MLFLCEGNRKEAVREKTEEFNKDYLKVAVKRNLFLEDLQCGCEKKRNGSKKSPHLWFLQNVRHLPSNSSLDTTVCFHYKIGYFPKYGNNIRSRRLFQRHLLLISSHKGLKPQVCFCHEAIRGSALSQHSSHL